MGADRGPIVCNGWVVFYCVFWVPEYRLADGYLEHSSCPGHTCWRDCLGLLHTWRFSLLLNLKNYVFYGVLLFL